MLLDYHAVDGQIDRRSHTRVGVDLFSLYSESDQLAPGRVHDLSVSGLLLEADSELSPGGELDLLLKLDFRQRTHHMRVRGNVVREISHEGDHPRYGVAFSSISSLDRMLVDEYLASRIAPEGVGVEMGAVS